MADVAEPADNRFDDIDLENILARVERRGPLTFTRKRCLYRAPEFVKKLPKEETVEEGSTVKFECKAVGFPKPTVSWTKDLELIPDNPRITFHHGELGEASIEIQKIKKSDEGSYRCKAENAEGSSSSTVYISIKAKPKSPKRSQQRVITFTSAFTTITERIDEEEREAEEFMRQPISPLTYLYDGVTIKEKSWPEFLGNWAFLASDFEGMDENMDDIDDEDVFLSGSTEITDTETSFNSEKDSDTESAFDTDLSNATIPNLIFENKNLINGKPEVHYNCSTGVFDRHMKDENANNKISNTLENDISSKNVLENGIKHNSTENGNLCSVTKLDNSLHINSRSVDKRPILNCNDSCPTLTIKQDNGLISNLDFKQANGKPRNISSSQKRPLTAVTSLSTPLSAEKSPVNSVLSQRSNNISFNLTIFVFLVSAITFLALASGVAPTDFVFVIFTAHIIYGILKYLCSEV